MFCHSVASSNPIFTITGIAVWCFYHSVRDWGTSVEILVFLCSYLVLLKGFWSHCSVLLPVSPYWPPQGQGTHSFTACWKSALQKRISDFLPAVLITCLRHFIPGWVDSGYNWCWNSAASVYSCNLGNSHLPEAARKCGLPRSAESVTRAVRAWGAGIKIKDWRCWGCLC